MSVITASMAQGLIKLLTVISENNDKHPDWIDAVCTASEALPPETLEALTKLVANPG